MLICSPAVAQSDSNPNWDLFVGYQWLHPGGTVPAPFGDPTNPVPFKIPDMAAGFGSALTYTFDPHWGLEFDLGHNWGSGNYETTGSVGPRFIWRTDGANYFPVSYTHLLLDEIERDLNAPPASRFQFPLQQRTLALKSVQHQSSQTRIAVSYTHLDVYKRQAL